MGSLSINGVRLNVVTAGQGQDVVMVHGLAANLAFWYLSSVPTLARSYRVVTYDLRGHGRSEMTGAGYSPRALAGDLAALLDELEIEQVHLVGHSFGGAVALEYAHRHAERVRSLALADATVYSLQPIDDGHDWSYWQSWRRELRQLGIEVPEALPRVAFGLLEEIADPRWRESRQRHRSGEFFVPFGLWNGARRTAERWLQLLSTTGAWSELQSEGVGLGEIGRLEMPLLLIYGERSRWLPTCRALAGAVPHAEVEIVPEVGHFFPLLRPRVFQARLVSFLERAGAPGRPTPLEAPRCDSSLFI